MTLTQLLHNLQRKRALRAERARIWAELSAMNARDLADLNISSADFPAMVEEHMRLAASKA